MAIVVGDVLGWWDCQDASSGTVTTVADQSTGGTAGTPTASPTWVTGGPTNLPRGISLNGSTQYITVSKDYDFPSSVGSAGVWVNITTRPTGTNEVVFIDNGNGGGELTVFMKGPTNNANYLSSRTRFGSDRDINSSTSVSTGTLYFIFYNFASGAMELFLNGSSVGTNTNTGVLNDTGNNFRWGSYAGTPFAFFNGKIHQVTLFNRVLTGTEISGLYNSGAGKTYAQQFSPPAAVSSPDLRLAFI